MASMVAPAKPGRPPSSRGNSTTAVASNPVSQAGQAQQATPTATAPMHPPPKTDKPRPHVCATCTRPFARLEHLKRHERSHTKEKPFECPECTRCFARRDLLLRHQQKLHYQTTPSSRPRNGNRRDSQPNISTAVTGGGRVRKNSVSTTSTTTPTTVTGRPRANTIAHVDTSTLNMLTNASGNQNSNDNASGNRNARVTKINTHNVGMGMGGVNPMMATNALDLDGLFFGTVNPASLQLYGSPLQQPLGSPTSPFGATTFPSWDNNYGMDEDFGWLDPFNKDMDGRGSPSITSQSGISEAVLENWGGLTSTTSTTSMSSHFNNQADYTYSYGNTPPGTVSPRSLMQASADGLFPAPALSGLPLSPSMAQANFSQYPVYGPEPPSTSRSTTAIIQSCVETLGDSTRNALLTALALPSAFQAASNGNPQRRRYSTSAAMGMSVNYFSNTRPAPSVALPSTEDLRRYITAYFEHFHPHMPFLHIPTLDFGSATFITSYKDIGSRGSTGGGGCLVLAMAAIGALYSGSTAAARELFESTKKTITVALDDRRRADMAAAMNQTQRNGSGGNRHTHTPLWLVQALLLNITYGLHCADRAACEAARAWCTTLVSLARSAGLMTKSVEEEDKDVDMQMADLGLSGFGEDEDSWLNLNSEMDEDDKWKKWISREERKRTLFAIHLLSSLLVACHNSAPVLNNTEIQLDLPCHENLWTAWSTSVWKEQGGAVFAEQTSLNFQSALSTLISAGQQPFPPPPEFDGSNNLPCPPSQIVTSSWGCLALLCAIHIYIYEIQQGQNGTHWTSAGAEAIHAHIEPALKAWQAAWLHIPQNRCDKSGLFMMPPLSCDCIPMLDLAYTRLYVDFGPVKDAFWNNDMETMAEELSKSWRSYQTGINHSPSSTSSVSFASDALISPHSPVSSPASTNSSPNIHPIKVPLAPISSNHFSANSFTKASRRERHLRKAACYAADSLSMSNPMFMGSSPDQDWNLPMQFSLCTFDCALVLGEWIATVQERVGSCMGVLGTSDCNLESLESMCMLEEEDRTLLNKVINLLGDAEIKLSMKWNNNFSAMRMGAKTPSSVGSQGGLAAMVFMLGAYMLDKMIVWPGMCFQFTFYPTGLILFQLHGQWLKLFAHRLRKSKSVFHIMACVDDAPRFSCSHGYLVNFGICCTQVYFTRALHFLWRFLGWHICGFASFFCLGFSFLYLHSDTQARCAAPHVDIALLSSSVLL